MITSRKDWGAKLGPGPVISVPTPFLHIHHTVTNAVSGSVADEKAHMRFLEFVRGFSIGVPYSFCIFPSGRVYEGQGWGRKGAHTCNTDGSECWNSNGHGFAFIGNHEITRPTSEAVRSMRDLIVLGQVKAKLAHNVTIRPHRAVKATACPGQHVLPHMTFFQEGDEMTDAEKKQLKEAHNLANALRKALGATNFGGAGTQAGNALKQLADHLAQHPGGGGSTHEHGDDVTVAGPVV